MTATTILIGLGAWTVISLVVGLGVGAVLKHGAAADELLVPVPQQAPLRRSA
jgi:hypothetical protein